MKVQKKCVQRDLTIRSIPLHADILRWAKYFKRLTDGTTQTYG